MISGDVNRGSSQPCERVREVVDVGAG
jgi:flavin reductase (DIM6/NTAB) family NADH-FMN oxidoreductase RutF